MSRRRQRVSTGSTNLGRAPSSSQVPRHREKPNRLSTAAKHRLKFRGVFPPRQKPATAAKEPQYPPLKNVHRVPTPVDYDSKLGFRALQQEKVRTQKQLFAKQRRGRLPGLTSTDIDDDGVIDTTEIRLAAVMREMEGADHMSEEEKVHVGRTLLAKELIMDLDDMELLRMGKQFEKLSREDAVAFIANDPNFRERFNEYTIKKATAKLQSSTGAKLTLQQMETARLAVEQEHAARKAKHDRNIWRASRSRAAELARRINTADRFRAATEGFNTLSAYSKLLARNKHVALNRVNLMHP